MWAIKKINDIYIDKIQFPHGRKPIWKQFLFLNWFMIRGFFIDLTVSKSDILERIKTWTSKCAFIYNAKLKKNLKLFKLVYVQKWYFIYINSINNVCRIYAHKLNDNSYSAIRIRPFSLRANEYFETVCEIFLSRFFCFP